MPIDLPKQYEPRQAQERWYGFWEQHRYFDADPNPANFSFLADGRVVVYDYGCVKSVPRHIVKG